MKINIYIENENDWFDDYYVCIDIPFLPPVGSEIYLKEDTLRELEKKVKDNGAEGGFANWLYPRELRSTTHLSKKEIDQYVSGKTLYFGDANIVKSICYFESRNEIFCCLGE